MSSFCKQADNILIKMKLSYKITSALRLVIVSLRVLRMKLVVSIKLVVSLRVVRIKLVVRMYLHTVRMKLVKTKVMDIIG